MKIAVAFVESGSDRALDEMLASQKLRPWHTSHDLAVQGGGAAGYVSTDRSSAGTKFVKTATNGNWLAVPGIPIDLEQSVEETMSRCLQLPLDDALEMLTRLDGAFAAIYWEAATCRLGIVTDFLGMQPLHIVQRKGLMALSTDAKALGAARLVSGEMDPAGWGAFLSMKHPIGARTMIKDVERVPAASVMVYDSRTDTLSSRVYWRWPELHDAPMEEQPVREIVETLLCEMKAYLRHEDSAQLCLSGGFDSRMMLACLVELGFKPRTWCLSHADELLDTDARLASRLSRLYQVEFTLKESDPTFFSSTQYLDYIAANEVATPSLYLFIAQLASKLEPEMRAIWEGVFPGIILRAVNQPGGFAPYFRKVCAPFDSLVWQAAERVFQPELVLQMRESFKQELERERNQYPDDDSGVWRFFLHNRTRRRTAINPLQVYSNDVLSFTPAISKRLWSLAAAIPYSLRADHRLYREIFRKFFPKAMKLPALPGTTPHRLGTVVDHDYVLARAALFASRHPKVAALMHVAGFGAQGAYWSPSKLVDSAVATADIAHPDLLQPHVESITKAHPPYDPVTEKARELLFYWSYWRRYVTGDLPRSVRSNDV